MFQLPFSTRGVKVAEKMVLLHENRLHYIHRTLEFNLVVIETIIVHHAAAMVLSNVY